MTGPGAGAPGGDEALLRLRSMDGLAVVRRLLEEPAELAAASRALGYRLVTAGPGRVTLRLVPGAVHLTQTRIVHGGVTAALCDSACGYAVQTLLPPGAYPVTRELRLRYRAPAYAGGGGTLTCVATASPPDEEAAGCPSPSLVKAVAVVSGPEGTRLVRARATVAIRAGPLP
ncbi:PaaI family thioesterase [Streptomyces stramineus]|uniref:Thioesterase domain-containing protein n=1 Tax=Streptomyces stramineus TaxID=173861 RepID=A0ABP3J5E0_9ACTN